jgi:CBS domain-containing protein
MDWHRVRHLPVEDNTHRLVGIVSYRALLRLLTSDRHDVRGAAAIPVSEVMRRDPVTIGLSTSSQRAIAIMREFNVGCLPVVHNDRLVGLVTEHDFTDIAGQLLDQRLAEP